MGLTTRLCPSPRCRREVVTLLVTGQTGAHKEEVVDPDPTTWDGGGRIRLMTHQPDTAKYPLGRRLQHAGQAFGATGLYRPHSTTCGGGTGRAAPRNREHG
ncbi:MAG TPA: hypothetical protein VF516_12430 [Kofleriaceae bacterium]